MGLRDKFKTDKKKLAKQQEEYAKSRDYKPNDYATFFELSDGMQQFLWNSTKEGKAYNVDIIPFLVEKNFPDKMFRGSPPNEDEPWFTVDLHVHNNIGPGNEKVVCPKNTFKSGIAAGNRPGCPICEDLAKKQEALSDDPERRKAVWKEMKPQRRNLYNVIVRDNGEEEEKGVQFFDVAYFYFQQNIEEVLDEDEDGVSTYWDIEEGKQIRFKVVDQGEGQAAKFTGFKLKDRKYEIDDQDLKESVSPQRWIKLYSYDEIYTMHHQNVPTQVEEKVEEEEDDPPTPRRSRRTTSKPVVEDDDDIPSKAESEQGSDGNECPFGHTFGVDAGGFDECQEDCDDPQYKRCLKFKVDSENKAKEDVPEKETRRSRRRK